MQQENLDLLTSIYQNCKIAILSIQDIEKDVQDEELRAELREEQARYEDFCKKCEDIASKNDTTLPDNNFFEKAKLWTSIKLSTLTDKSTRHIAEMLLLGTDMGTLQCYKDLCDHNQADKDLLELCGELLQIEEKHFNYLKLFLKNIHN